MTIKKIALQKKYSLSAPEEEDTRAPPHRIGSSRLNHQTSYVFLLRIQMILRTQFRGSEAFSNVIGAGGEGGGLIVHHAQRIHVCVVVCLEQKAVSLLVTLTVFGSFIIK